MAPSKGTKVRHIRVTDQLWESLKRLAEIDKTTASEVIRTAIEDYVQERKAELNQEQ